MADLIRQVLAERLQKGLRDPRMGYVTITDVSVTGDLQHASVFYTVLGDDKERADTQRALAAATGMLRSEVGKNITARLTPSWSSFSMAFPKTPRRLRVCFNKPGSGMLKLNALLKVRSMPVTKTPIRFLKSRPRTSFLLSKE